MSTSATTADEQTPAPLPVLPNQVPPIVPVPAEITLLSIWLSVGSTLALAVALLFGLWKLKSALTSDQWNVLLEHHWPAIAGVPASAIIAFCVILTSRAFSTLSSIQCLGIKAEGMAATATLWIVSFILVVIAIRILW